MKANRSRLVAGLIICCAITAAAQTPGSGSPPTNFAEELKTLKWKDIDLQKVSLLERCRALLVLNHGLDQAGPAATAQADLMSKYLQQQDLGTAFAASPPPSDPNPLVYTDGLKIAVALIRGPLAQSSYATEFAGLTDDMLRAYEHMYDATCQRKWSEVSECRQYLTAMTAFLKGRNKLQEFGDWAPIAAEEQLKQQQEQEAQQRQMAQNKAAAEAQAKQAQRQAAHEAAAGQEQREATAAQVQQALGTAQAALAAASQAGSSSAGGDDYGLWYPGWYYHNPAAVRAGALYSDPAYRATARDGMNQRFDQWHAAARR